QTLRSVLAARNGHAIGHAARGALDQCAGERRQKHFVEAQDSRRLLVRSGRADLERRPQRGAAAEIVDRGEIKIQRVDRLWWRYCATAEEGKTRRLAFEAQRRRRFEVAIRQGVRRV